METIVFYSYLLIVAGVLMLIGAFIGLAYSKKEENEVIKIFQEQSFTLTDRFVQPFRMHQNGDIHFHVDSRAKDEVGEDEPVFNAYLTDLYANIELAYSYGPRYMEYNRLGSFSKTLDLKIGEYNLIFENLGTVDIFVNYDIYLIYPEYPYSKYVDWALAFVDIGVSMLLVGLTLYLGS
jgi:hypothetical protein